MVLRVPTWVVGAHLDLGWVEVVMAVHHSILVVVHLWTSVGTADHLVVAEEDFVVDHRIILDQVAMVEEWILVIPLGQADSITPLASLNPLKFIRRDQAVAFRIAKMGPRQMVFLLEDIVAAMVALPGAVPLLLPEVVAVPILVLMSGLRAHGVELVAHPGVVCQLEVILMAFLVLEDPQLRAVAVVAVGITLIVMAVGIPQEAIHRNILGMVVVPPIVIKVVLLVISATTMEVVDGINMVLMLYIRDLELRIRRMHLMIIRIRLATLAVTRKAVIQISRIIEVAVSQLLLILTLHLLLEDTLEMLVVIHLILVVLFLVLTATHPAGAHPAMHVGDWDLRVAVMGLQKRKHLPQTSRVLPMRGVSMPLVLLDMEMVAPHRGRGRGSRVLMINHHRLLRSNRTLVILRVAIKVAPTVRMVVQPTHQHQLCLLFRGVDAVVLMPVRAAVSRHLVPLLLGPHLRCLCRKRPDQLSHPLNPMVTTIHHKRQRRILLLLSLDSNSLVILMAMGTVTVPTAHRAPPVHLGNSSDLGILARPNHYMHLLWPIILSKGLGHKV